MFKPLIHSLLFSFLLITAYSCKDVSKDLEKKDTLSDSVKTDSVYVFDVPKLLKLDLENIRKQLGKPKTNFRPTEEQKLMKILPVLEYKKGTTFIFIEYDSSKVQKIFISDNFKERTVEEIMKLGKLELNHSDYAIKISEWKRRSVQKNDADTAGIAGIEVMKK